MDRASFIVSGFAAFLAGGNTSALAKIERHSGGRLGVFAIDTGTNKTLSHRAHERFPMCSTFKFLAVSAVLARVDSGREHLNRRIAIHRSDLLEYAPATRAALPNGSMTVEALCAAAIELSDNTAANLLLGVLGGPAGVTRYARSLGDSVTRLDRTEPTLNTAIPGDPRDTTSPLSTARDMQQILLGNALSVHARSKLKTWMFQCKTGKKLIQAGVPHSWRVGDKTGNGGPKNALGANNTHNDIAIIYTPNSAPIIVTAYLTASQLSSEETSAALASVGRQLALFFS
jgi:beta-lactamase class A